MAQAVLKLFTGKCNRSFIPIRLNFSKIKSFSSLSEIAAPREPISKPKEKGAHIGAVKPDGRTIKWYRKASIEYFSRATETGWLVKLDGRIVKTPKENRLLVPSKQLAMAIGAEWEAQGERIQPVSMPLMTLSATAIDVVPEKRSIIVGMLVEYLRADTLIARSPQLKLRMRQTKLHDPLLNWFGDTFQLAPPEIVYGFDSLPSLSPQTEETIQWMFYKMDDFQLAGFESLTQNNKSLILALALWQNRISVGDAFAASRLEEEWNLEHWGSIPGSHDVEASVTKMNVIAANLFMNLLPPESKKIPIFE